jgi:hypothetical protein
LSGRIRRLHDVDLEPEVRDWLDSLSDSDYTRVDEVCGMLAEKRTELGGPWRDHLDGPVWHLRIRLRDVAARITYSCTAARDGHPLTVVTATGTARGRPTSESAQLAMLEVCGRSRPVGTRAHL